MPCHPTITMFLKNPMFLITRYVALLLPRILFSPSMASSICICNCMCFYLAKKKKIPLPKLKDRSRKCFRISCHKSVQLGKIWSQSVSSLHTLFRGDKIQNHVLYSTHLIALEMLDKERAAVDTVFCPLSIYVLDPEKSKDIIFSLWGHENI